MTQDEDPGARLFSPQQIEQLRLIAGNAEILMAVARAHSALILTSHVLKWLSAILGTLVLLRGFFPW